ncbi:MAG: RagB/SusD family nutrient uptake outer membrane protein [Prevotellaceae bacterium]|jgi:hypothetical protein|nr:RagB/SusD family nutrient uptake outer membrane protein [Prevotellaceae bacterium]
MRKYIIIAALALAATAVAQQHWIQVGENPQHNADEINRITFPNEGGVHKIKIEPISGSPVSHDITPGTTAFTYGYTPTEQENEELINSLIENMYSMDGMGRNNVYRNRVDLFFHANTDIERNRSVTASTMINQNNGAGLAAYNITASDNNSGLQEVWTGIYQNIDICNGIIKEVLAMNPAPSNTNRTGALLAEAYTMRAFYYYDLISWWGDVPAFFTPLEMPNYAYPAPVMKRELIYDQILADLLTAQNYLSDANKPASILHPSLEAVQAFRARVALAAAGYALRPISQLSDYASNSTQNEFAFVGRVKLAKYISYLTIAKDETQKVIAKYGTGKLLPSFQNVFLAISRGEEADGNTESLWEMRYRNQFMYGWGLRNNNPSTGTRGYVTGSLWWDYDRNDTRRDVSIAPWEWNSGSITPAKINTLSFAKLRPEWAAGNTDMLPAGNDTYRGRVVVRYADVLLMYAEACLELGENMADATEKFNWVRRRAFGASITVSNAGVDKALTLQNIMDERKLEFVGEQLRKRDLIRWGKLKEAMDAEANKCIDLQNAYNGTPSNLSNINYSDVPKQVWCRMSSTKTDPVTGTPVIEFYGMNRGETEDKSGDASWTSTPMWSSSSLAGGTAFYEKCFYSSSVNPDLRSLLPISIMVIASSNGMLSNVYGY